MLPWGHTYGRCAFAITLANRLRQSYRRWVPKGEVGWESHIRAPSSKMPGTEAIIVTTYSLLTAGIKDRGKYQQSTDFVGDGTHAHFRPPPTSTLAPTMPQTFPRLLLSQAELLRPSFAQYRLDPQQFRHSPAVPQQATRPSRTHSHKVTELPARSTNRPILSPGPASPLETLLARDSAQTGYMLSSTRCPFEFNASRALALSNIQHGSFHHRRRPTHPNGLHRRIPPRRRQPQTH
jgi:hypothetical protein